MGTHPTGVGTPLRTRGRPGEAGPEREKSSETSNGHHRRSMIHARWADGKALRSAATAGIACKTSPMAPRRTTRIRINVRAGEQESLWWNGL